MKIKHFAGYGSVNARKISEVKVTTNIKRVVIKVIGNHERGLYRNDHYDVFHWLVTRFCKDCQNERSIYHIDIEDTEERINGLYTEVCFYTIDYFI